MDNAVLKKIPALASEGNQAAKVPSAFIGTLYAVANLEGTASMLVVGLGALSDPVLVPFATADLPLSEAQEAFYYRADLIDQSGTTVALTEVRKGPNGKVLAAVAVKSGFHPDGSFTKTYTTVGQRSGKFVKVLYDGRYEADAVHAMKVY